MKDLAYRAAPVVSVLPAASAALAGVIARLSTDNKPYWCDGTAWVDMTLLGSADTRLTTARLAADVTNNTTTLANVTGLAIALAANSTYAIDAQVMFQTAETTTGIRLTQTVPTGATVVAQWSTPTSLTASTLANQRAVDVGAATTAIDTANANTLARGSILVVTGATAGNLQICFASEVAASNAVVKAGSNLVATKVA
ncbi:hypothetical protein SKTS_30600 [Sulfurimicrobium lacus]|uniref:Uncharacterized protein n=1 Tax=Sulfurimicrobium lacus TaxID=2715678 RepID=A0A6F8VER5_9PROT|nr:hypothetical protein [Sulfurimicrobium lacus]BCB28174.1 hypothetical protein SKTS_30600 [Sulfurimicrobium lacus]